MHDYSYYRDKYNEYGQVTKITYPIVTVVGLPKVKLNEIVVFEFGEKGQVIGLEENSVSVLLFSQTSPRIGSQVARSDEHLSVPVGEELLGHMLTPFGTPLNSNDSIPHITNRRSVDTAPGGIAERAKITKQLATGAALVDIVIPLGRGQKELVIGDRKTGKSSFVLSTILRQIDEDAITIYAAIGKKKSDIKSLEEFMNQGERKKNMIIIATNGFDSPGLIYLTPFTAMTIAEYFREQGREVLVIMDDLLTHAKFYREFALLAETFPGRDSYPGDIFYIHAKLLERAGNFVHPQKGQAAISCLPIVETQEGDLTSYIVSNLMSITDGHLFFDNNIFTQGRRPAINIPLSVTRVGKQTQDQIGKDINRELSSLFTMYDRIENLSHFGSEMTESVKSIFSIGSKVHHFFTQPASLILPKDVYLVLFALVWLNIITDEEAIDDARDKLLKAYAKPENKLFLHSFLSADTFNDLLKNVREHKDLIFKLWESSDTVPTNTQPLIPVSGTTPPSAQQAQTPPATTTPATPANPAEKTMPAKTEAPKTETKPDQNQK